MSDIVISVENLSKYYRLGLIGGGTLREDVSRWWAKVRRKPDPLLKIGEESHGNRKNGEIWALRDVNFEIKKGEIVGIIGNNGAGKSTLLKILSRITAPTSGRAIIRGRVGSLLEVGTGFHPELTGRENIYLNGTILGMKRADVDSKLQEIVEFAEMGKFIDTPVKRYSSGMTVRLAFSVAAHLEPDVLIVDEVLAVGDAEFQRKCLGKMKAVSADGRTIIFVSHNLNAIQMLCEQSVLLDRGKIISKGHTNAILEEYLARIKNGLGLIHFKSNSLSLVSVDAEYQCLGDNKCQICVRIKFQSLINLQDLYIDFGLENKSGVRLIQVMPMMHEKLPLSLSTNSFFYYVIDWISTELSPNEYFCTVYAQSKSLGVLLYQSNIPLFRVMPNKSNKECLSANFTSVLLPKYRTKVLYSHENR